MTEQRIARGTSIYVDSGCPSCHGAEGRGDGRSGQDLKTAEGDPIIPRDLTHKWSFRGGHTPSAIYRRIANGMDGSSMAAYDEVLEPNDLWDLVFYVLSLSPEQRPRRGSRSCSREQGNKEENMGKLDGQVAVITGGASGIGAATVRLFAAEGARVVVADMQEDKGQEMAQELGDQGAFVQVNVTQEAEVKAAIDTAVERWGRLDCIYNNAGFGGGAGTDREHQCGRLRYDL